ncbi:uncharacterized protein LOC119980928 [Tripterygium wilfordii]|uniref:uncharacterized protein LOC119980928 n=1 Tax=Tripterygium wilfordii TaxID=458696 RepID=UPI0018F84B1A|nr:uncharacterized protein LOC119980928 [Tripterygium wilfordii]XP_038679749.1 uncharacterized protein LOC119980928 [Tripterygium wilfordii]
MASSAAGPSDLNKSSSLRKKVADSNDQFTNQKASADVDGGLTMPNQGPKTLNLGASIGDTDQIAVGQLSAKQAGKRPRRETDAKHYNKKKMMLEDYKKMFPEFEKVKLENENLRKNQKWIEQKMEADLEMIKEVRSLLRSVNSKDGARNQNMDSLSLEMLDLYKANDQLKMENDQLKKENDQLKMENECWKILKTQQPPVDSSFYGQFQNMPGPSPSMPIGGGGSVSHITPQQQHVNPSFSDQFQNMPGPSPSMPTDGGGSVSHITPQQQHVNPSFSDQFRSMPGPSQPIPIGNAPQQQQISNMLGPSPSMPTDGGGSESHITPQQQHVNPSFSNQFQNMPGPSPSMPIGGGGSVSHITPQQQHVNPSFSDQFRNMPGPSQYMPTDDRGIVSQQRHVNSSFFGQHGPLQPMQTDGGGTLLPFNGQ